MLHMVEFQGGKTFFQVKCSDKGLTDKFSQRTGRLGWATFLTGGMMSKDIVKCQSVIFWLYSTSNEKSQKVF